MGLKYYKDITGSVINRIIWRPPQSLVRWCKENIERLSLIHIFGIIDFYRKWFITLLHTYFNYQRNNQYLLKA